MVAVALLLAVPFTAAVASGSTVTAYASPLESSPTAPEVVYNNATNFPPLWNATLNSSKDSATLNLTSIWSSGIYVDDYGNLLWTDTYGSVLVYYIATRGTFYLGTPYSSLVYAGPITSIAAINDSFVQEVVVLSEWGYVFAHPIGTGSWFNATSTWSLPLVSKAQTWTAVTSNVEGDNNFYDEGFWFIALNGDAYFYDTTSPRSSTWIVSSAPGIDSIAAVANYPADYAKADYAKNVYSVSYGGTVYVLLRTGWRSYDASGISGTIGITIDQTNGHIFLLDIANHTRLYKSSTTAGSASGTFSPVGANVFSQNTATGLTFDDYDSIFWAIQTNGTVAEATSPSTWYYSDNLLLEYYYPAVLAVRSLSSVGFYASAQYVGSGGLTHLQVFNLSLSEGASDYLQFSYYLGVSRSPQTLAPLAPGSSLDLNVTLVPNSSYNASLSFLLVLSTSNTDNGIIMQYLLDVHVTDHFPFLPL